jgi:tetratricopeptide (TPR) repeat protein
MEEWEVLCKQEPSNPGFAFELAEAYELRGWRKKAIAEYQRGIELDRGSPDCWGGIIRCYSKTGEWEEAKPFCQEALKAIKESGKGDLLLYYTVFLVCAPDDSDIGRDCLQNIIRLIRQGNLDSGDMFFKTGIIGILHCVPGCDLLKLFPYIQEIVGLLPHTDHVRDLFEDAKLHFEFRCLEKNGFSDLFHDLFAILLNEDDSLDGRLSMAAMECHILVEKEKYHPQLLRLEKEFPKIYALHSAFFNEALRTKDPQKMIQKRLKMLDKHNFAPAGFDDDDFGPPPEPIRREGPKVGRNDPCPCGSGKKYKKCCGR